MAVDALRRVESRRARSSSKVPAIRAAACAGSARSTASASIDSPPSSVSVQPRPARASARTPAPGLRTAPSERRRATRASTRSPTPPSSDRNALPLRPSEPPRLSRSPASRARRCLIMPRTSEPCSRSMATSCGNADRTERSLASPAEMPPRSGATRRSAASRPSLRRANSAIDSSPRESSRRAGTSGSSAIRSLAGQENSLVVTSGTSFVGMPRTSPSGTRCRRPFHAM